MALKWGSDGLSVDSLATILLLNGCVSVICVFAGGKGVPTNAPLPSINN